MRAATFPALQKLFFLSIQSKKQAINHRKDMQNRRLFEIPSIERIFKTKTTNKKKLLISNKSTDCSFLSTKSSQLLSEQKFYNLLSFDSVESMFALELISSDCQLICQPSYLISPKLETNLTLFPTCAFVLRRLTLLPSSSNFVSSFIIL